VVETAPAPNSRSRAAKTKTLAAAAAAKKDSASAKADQTEAKSDSKESKPVTSSASSVEEPSTSKRSKVSVEEPAIATGGIKSFKCRTCGMMIKMDAQLDESEHKCTKVKLTVPVRPRMRLRGLPPYQYLNEEGTVVVKAAQRRTAIKKPGTAGDNKPKNDPERDAWLRDHVMGKVYDKDEVWCRYCGCQIASGFSRGPWVSLGKRG
jgi:hypothetical protein